MSDLYLGFDPGRDKCGLALVRADGQILEHRIVPSAEAVAELARIWRSQPVAALVIGDQTTSRQWQLLLRAEADLPPLVPVNERNSTLEARQRYWQLFPARGWRRLLPRGLRQPPRPVDDIVAILLVERHLARLRSGPES